MMLKQLNLCLSCILAGLSLTAIAAKESKAVTVVYPTEVEFTFPSFPPPAPPPVTVTLTLQDTTTIEIPDELISLPNLAIPPVCVGGLSCPTNILEPIGFVSLLEIDPTPDPGIVFGDPSPQPSTVYEIFTGFNFDEVPLAEIFPGVDDNILDFLTEQLVGFPEEIEIVDNTIIGNVTGESYSAEFIFDTTVGDLGQLFMDDDLEQVSALLSEFEADDRIVIAQHQVPFDDLVAPDSESVPEPSSIFGFFLLVASSGVLKLKKAYNKGDS